MNYATNKQTKFFVIALVVCFSPMYLCDVETQTSYKTIDPLRGTLCRTLIYKST